MLPDLMVSFASHVPLLEDAFVLVSSSSFFSFFFRDRAMSRPAGGMWHDLHDLMASTH
jgi:hypothetical protein